MLIHSLELIFIILPNLLDALFSCLDGPLNCLDLCLAASQLSDFLVKYLVHNIKLEFLDALDEFLSVIEGNWNLHLIIVPLFEELVIELFCNCYLRLEVGACTSLNELIKSRLSYNILRTRHRQLFTLHFVP